MQRRRDIPWHGIGGAVGGGGIEEYWLGSQGIYMLREGSIVVRIADLHVEDLSEAIGLWNSIPELVFPSAFDTAERLSRFLNKNVGLSSIAKEDDKIIGALLCGNDGRRGFFYHIGVTPECRKRGIARQMVEYSFEKLRGEDIDTCFLFTNDFNRGAQAFWKPMGFEHAPHVMYQSREI